MTETEPKSYPRTIAVDFDGVIHAYISPWTSALDVHDPPVPGAIGWLRGLLADGWRVFLNTTRLMHSVDPEHTEIEEVDLESRIKAIRDWFKAHEASDITANRRFILWTAGGKPHAEVYLDDRALRFEGTFPTLKQLNVAARPWNKGGARSVVGVALRTGIVDANGDTHAQEATVQAAEQYGHRNGHAVTEVGDCAPWCEACRLEEADRSDQRVGQRSKLDKLTARLHRLKLRQSEVTIAREAGLRGCEHRVPGQICTSCRTVGLGDPRSRSQNYCEACRTYCEMFSRGIVIEELIKETLAEISEVLVPTEQVLGCVHQPPSPLEREVFLERKNARGGKGHQSYLDEERERAGMEVTS